MSEAANDFTAAPLDLGVAIVTGQKDRWLAENAHLVEDQRRKRLATLQAVAALKGVAVTPIDDDRGRQVFIVSRWSLTKQCDTLDDVAALLARMGIAE